MLTSNDLRDRLIGLERLQEIYPKIRLGVDLFAEYSPSELHAKVTAILERK
jgi:hypothetical protein